ncbi:hypothetical protein GJAV_G00122260 [Gymnothorax javanicus]|nr:hypothetical protein GJAV_G00122260 [Gymnothorax javanicus]
MHKVSKEDVSNTEVTVSTVGLDSQTEGAYIVVSINQSQMASPSYRTVGLDGTYDSFSDPYSQSETFPPAVQCLSPVPSSGEVKAEFGFESTNYTIEEPKERFMKSEGMEGGIEWNCAGGMMEERHQLFNIKEEEESVRMEENHECGMTTKEKKRMDNLKIEEEEDEEVEESEERRIVKIKLEEDVGENMGFGIKKEEVIDEYEETSGTDLNFPTYRCEGKGVESEFSRQEGELSLSSLVTECLLRQPRVLIKQLNMTGFSVTVSPSLCSMANTEDQGVRSPLGPGKFVSCKRKKTGQIERTQTQLPASLENGICINASHNPLDSSFWRQSKGETIEASSPVFVCSLCSFVHADEVNFLQHIEKVHPAGQWGALVSVDSDAENPTHCRTYQRPKSYKTYPTSPQPCSGTSGAHKQLYQCSQCGKSFKCKSLLAGHQRTHTGERPYQCSMCGQNFMCLGHLVTHQRMHIGERPYHCSQCGKDFLRSEHLVRHQRTHSGERPYRCSQCGKKFRELNCLIIHQRTHTGQRPYQCSECGKSFFCSAHLFRHQRNHSEEGPFLCSQCGKAFRNVTSLQVHQRTHTGERPYHCSLCGKNFIRFSALWKHQKHVYKIGLGFCNS